MLRPDPNFSVITVFVSKRLDPTQLLFDRLSIDEEVIRYYDQHTFIANLTAIFAAYNAPGTAEDTLVLLEQAVKEDRAIRTSLAVVNDKNEKHGPYRKYHANGQIAEDGQYSYNREDGLWSYYDEEGHLTAEGSYDRCNRQGTWFLRCENGLYDVVEFEKGVQTKVTRTGLRFEEFDDYRKKVIFEKRPPRNVEVKPFWRAAEPAPADPAAG